MLYPKHEQWRISEILRRITSKSLDHKPDFQRRVVWDDKKQDKFLESISLGYPVGILSLIKQDNRYEVLDGQQRVTTLINFFHENRDFSPGDEDDDNNSFFTDDYNESDDDIEELSEHVSEVYNALAKYQGAEQFGKSEPELYQEFLSYIVPVTIIDIDDIGGDKKLASRIAIDAFTRMNVNLEKLNNVEIWNAQFTHHDLIKYAREISNDLEDYICQELNKTKLRDKSLFFQQFCGYKDKEQSRMVDYRVILEFLVLSLRQGHSGNRRDQVTEYLQGNSNIDKQHKEKVLKLLIDLYKRFPGGIQKYVVGGITRGEHLLYAIMSIYLQPDEKIRNKPDSQEWENFRNSIAKFTRLVSDFTSLSADQIEDSVFSGAVVEYGLTFRGQINSAPNRDIRKKIIKELLDDCMSTQPRKEFTKSSKDLIWHKAKVGEDIYTRICNFEEFCSNKDEKGNPRSHKKQDQTGADQTFQYDHVLEDAKNGDNSPENGQIICSECNQPAIKEIIMNKIEESDRENETRKKFFRS